MARQILKNVGTVPCGGSRRRRRHNFRRADLDVHRPGVILPQARACATPASSNLKLQGPETGIETAPHPARHSRRKRRRKGVIGPIGSATEINWSVATQFYGRICVRKMRDLLDPSNGSPFRRWSKTLWFYARTRATLGTPTCKVPQLSSTSYM